ncbi:MAG: tRNA pseudouridine(38-40) synthase TruA [Lachnospiraceae bacterium]|nr:tRNA pseudouridine(38-40) synthase TruA [Lachnospiraceae bacterium]
MKRVMLVVAYEGTEYMGWQVQPGRVTVEHVLNQALSGLLGEEIRVIGASRTDSGVHSLGNVAVFDTNARMPADKISYALNQRLPEDIVVQQSREVAGDFHPRKCKSTKTYEYRILNRRFPMPTFRRDTYFYYRPLDVAAMQEAASYLVGRHDFKSFCSIHTQARDTVREIYDCQVIADEGAVPEGRLVTIRVQGSGFLYHMVRIIAGTLIQVGLGEVEPARLKDILEARDREAAGPTAPACGLTMMGIAFEEKS